MTAAALEGAEPATVVQLKPRRRPSRRVMIVLGVAIVAATGGVLRSMTSPPDRQIMNHKVSYLTRGRQPRATRLCLGSLTSSTLSRGNLHIKTILAFALAAFMLVGGGAFAQEAGDELTAEQKAPWSG